MWDIDGKLELKQSAWKEPDESFALLIMGGVAFNLALFSLRPLIFCRAIWEWQGSLCSYCRLNNLATISYLHYVVPSWQK